MGNWVIHDTAWVEGGYRRRASTSITGSTSWGRMCLVTSREMGGIDEEETAAAENAGLFWER